MSNPVVMDLGDFVPEEQQIRFSVSGRNYVVRYSEATVDEVFAMIASEPMGATAMENIERHRRIVTTFLGNHLMEGGKDQLAEDLKAVPYSNPGGLSIQALFEKIQLRVKKNDPGASPK